ncbi:hypothetical protein B0H66DRAFT_604769 [Apodospora peruviana]|uniref:DUF7871 domain-containing protein n=1 Tax=Apodospora peruviana TaxID=516989 RepID=A0AAE0I0S4_9PEZI|nr:hypothetical protein B0H66DRAFT_604769 [Apodospora peruviana]
MATQVVGKASTCCGKSAECSALHCTCDKAGAENSVQGARCSCRARPAGECTCDRAATENQKPSGDKACACGVRPADSCTCEKAAAATDGKYNPSENETDFTTQQK